MGTEQNRNRTERTDQH